MNLNYKTFGTGKPVIILHGLFGMLDNWLTVGKALAENFQVFLVDQRNHGKSPHTDAISFPLMADDLTEFMDQQNLSSASLIGHSMGGKTVMQFALNHPGRTDKLIVVDMGIKEYPEHHDTIFHALRSIDPLLLKYRVEAENILLEKVPEYSVRQFLLKNLTRKLDGTYQWKFNLPALQKHYGEILAPVTSAHPFTKDTLFIRGEKSDYIPDEDWPSILQLFPKAHLTTIENAGHWVHADQPEMITKVIKDFISRQ